MTVCAISDCRVTLTVFARKASYHTRRVEVRLRNCDTDVRWLKEHDFVSRTEKQSFWSDMCLFQTRLWDGR